MKNKRVMRRTAADNVYLHKDFHGALNQALIYIEKQFGEEAVREYLHQFSRAYYAPLSKELREKGLTALKDHFSAAYAREGAECQIVESAEALVLTIPRCPAVTHIRGMGLRVSPLFSETTRTVNEAICEGTPYQSELVAYNPDTGRTVVRFFRRMP